MRHISALTAVLCAASSLFMFAAAPHAGAQDVGSSRDAASATRRVRASDLDLTRPEHLEILERRIETAAREVCNEHLGVGSPGLYPKARCIGEARSRAWASVQSGLGRLRVRSFEAARDRRTTGSAAAHPGLARP